MGNAARDTAPKGTGARGAGAGDTGPHDRDARDDVRGPRGVRGGGSILADRGVLGAIGLMVLGMSLIPLGDTAGKLLTTRHDVAPGFVAFARFAVGAAMVALLLRGPVAWRLYRDPRVWLRAALIAGGIACILTALRTEEIASVFGAFFVGPIVSYALSVLLLRERAEPLRVLLLGVGFAGVLLVVRPGFDMSPGLLWAVAAGVFYGAFLTASRWLRDAAAPMQLMLTQTAMGTVLLAPLGMVAIPGAEVWAVPSGVGLVLLSGVASATGNILLILAYRRAEATILAPFVYTQLVSAALLGWLVFGTVPDAATAAGLGLLLAAGLATLALRRGGDRGGPR